MTTQPSVGEIVAITTTDSEPLLLVSSTTDDDVTGVLLADLATETLHRLDASEPDTATRRELAAAITQTDELMSFTVPTTDCAQVERDSSYPGPFEGGQN
ncbi:hypothetical protein ACM16X_17620 [Haloarcula japonica]|uniref:hypothetical protein n=1 Tax=Haloarcula japonica TaxID=29282 RepID=UPI0039F71C09